MTFVGVDLPKVRAIYGIYRSIRKLQIGEIIRLDGPSKDGRWGALQGLWFITERNNTMASMNFNTANQTFRHLMANGLTYRVPQFQRDYSWTQDEWDDLWQDMIALWGETPEPAHYMGYLVLQSSDSKQYDIIDGQQRMTTLSILVLAGIAYLGDLSGSGPEAERNAKRAEQLRNSYIGYLDPVTLIGRSKLELNRHNNRFYQNYLVPLETLPQRGLSASEHLLRKAFAWFKEKIKGYAGGSGEAVASFIDSLVDRLFFTVITVTDELNAFKVFETLNARGVRLSATDLLKNYLFSVISSENVHESELKVLEERWEAIIGLLGSESFPEFLRVFWNSQNKLVRKSELFKTIRGKIRDKAGAFALIRQLDQCANIYAGLRNPQDTVWAPEERDYLARMQMFNVRQPLALLLAAFRRYSDQDRDSFTRVLRAVHIVSFRYNVICNMQTNEQERVYNDIALRLHTDELKTSQDILNVLKRVYPEDASFQAAFADKELRTTNSRNKKVVRYILFEIEKQISGKDYDLESAKYNVEHILPEHPEEEWPDYNEHQDEKMIYRLGNMAILESNLNRDLGNAGYARKAEAYRQSVFSTTAKIPTYYETWGTGKIISRQTWMAKQAAAIWRLHFT